MSLPDPAASSATTFDEELVRSAGFGLPPAPGADRKSLAATAEELATGFRAPAQIERGVSIFGSARTPPETPEYGLAREVAARLGGAGFAIIAGGGPGIKEAGNRGATDAGARSVGCDIELLLEQELNDHIDIGLDRPEEVCGVAEAACVRQRRLVAAPSIDR